MNTILSTLMPLAELHFEGGTLIPTIAIVMPFLMIICIQVAKTIARTQQERMRYDLMRAAIERGQPIPAEALRPTVDPEELREAQNASPQNDIRTGLICVAVGAGLYMLLGTFSIADFDGLHGLRWVGAIPGFVGVALLVSGMLARTRETRTIDPLVPTAPPASKTEPRV